jgi:hypothetical protein
MALPRKEVLTKGIIAKFGNSPALRKKGVATKDELVELDEIARDPDNIKGVRANPMAMKNALVKILSDGGNEDPVGQSDAIIAAVQSGSSVANFLNIYSPGQRPGILSAGGRPRTTGWSNQNNGERQAPGQATVSGQDDEKTPDSPFNQGSPGDGYSYEAGHEQYGSTEAGGTGEDVSRGRARRSPSPGEDRDYTFGQGNTPHPMANPGRSGNYGAPASIVTSTSTPRVPVKKHVDESFKRFRKDAGAERANPVGFTALQEEGLRREEVRDSVQLGEEDETEALRRIKRLLEEEASYRRLAREEENEDARYEFEAKANASAQLRKQLATKMSIDTGIAATSIEKQIRRGRVFSLEK